MLASIARTPLSSGRRFLLPRNTFASSSSNKRYYQRTPPVTLSNDLIKQLRFETGAPILECRKALNASENDLEKATEWLREHGKAKMAKANRDATEGLVGLYIDETAKSAGFVQVASETDFTARSSEFVSLVSNTAMTVANAKAFSDQEIAIDDVLQLQDTSTSKPIQELVEDAIVAIRENISIRTAMQLQVSEDRDSFLVGYAHNRVDAPVLAGTAAAIVELERVDPELPEVNIRAIGKKLAMHIVAVPPLYLHAYEVPEEDVQRERTLIVEQARKRSKNDEGVNRILSDSLRKYYASVCLTEQMHSIEETMPNIGVGMKELGVEIKRFKRLEVS